MLDYLLETASFLPHGFCLLWRPDLVALHVVSDLAIGLAYFSIPLAILAFLRRRPDFEYRWVAYLFAAFIVLCGTTHFADVAMLWRPYYGLQGMIKLVTAVVSVTTAALLWPLLPRIVALPSPRLLQETNHRLEAEIRERWAAEGQLRQARDDLERQVAERITVDHALRASLAEKEVLLEEIRQTEESFRLLVDNVRDYAILRFDTEGRIATWNAGAERLYGWSAAEADGQPMRLLYPSGEMDEADRVLQMVRQAGRYEGEGWRVRKDGTRLWTHVIVTPLWDDQGQMRGYVKIAQDITEQKRVEAELRRAKDEAERANVAKSEFLASMSHELRTPLNAVIGFSDVMSTGIFGSLNQKYREYAKDIHRSGLHLLDLINDVLDMARIEAGQWELHEESVALGDLVQQAQRLAGGSAGEVRHRFEVQLPTPELVVRADRRSLRQVLINLIGNAVKFTPEGGRIAVGMSVGDGGVRIVVADTGIGIREERIADLCRPFVQVENVLTRRHHGSGMGLFISKAMVERHGGSLSIDSRLGQGTTVTINLPLERLLGGGLVQVLGYKTSPALETIKKLGVEA
jgi:PAS domain S-box-containing protein